MKVYPEAVIKEVDAILTWGAGKLVLMKGALLKDGTQVYTYMKTTHVELLIIDDDDIDELLTKTLLEQGAEVYDDYTAMNAQYNFKSRPGFFPWPGADNLK